MNALLSKPFEAGWEELTSVWPLTANHANRLDFSQNLTDPLINWPVLSVLRMIVNLLYLLKGQRSDSDLKSQGTNLFAGVMQSLGHCTQADKSKEKTVT